MEFLNEDTQCFGEFMNTSLILDINIGTDTTWANKKAIGNMSDQDIKDLEMSMSGY